MLFSGGPENLNAIAERFVRSVKSECLSKVLLFGEDTLRRALTEYVQHYHTERHHEGKDNQILFPESQPQSEGLVACKQRLGGALQFYYRKAAWVVGFPPTWMSSRWPQLPNHAVKPMLRPGLSDGVL
ncbi:transposase [bacterium]|nr:transposase [bacterium]